MLRSFDGLSLGTTWSYEVKTHRLTLLFCCALLAATLTTTSAFANGILRDSLGAISSGRGGANLSHEDNLSIIHDNPAGLGFMEENFRFELGADLLFTDVNYGDQIDADTSDDHAVLPKAAVSYKLPTLPLTVGLGVFLPGGYSASYKMDHTIFGSSRYRSEGMLLKVLPSIAWKINDYVSIGGSLGFGYSRAQFRLPYTFQTGALGGQSAKIDADTDAFGITGNFGVQVRPTDRLSFGLVYISETNTRQNGDFDVDLSGSPLSALFVDPTASYDLEYTLRWPRSVGAGSSYRFDFGRASFDFVWVNWANAFDDFNLNLSNGSNPEFDAVVGARPNETLPLDWRDAYSLRFGYEHYFPWGTTVRGGYIYNMNPIPSSTLTPLIPGVLEHSLAFGVGHDFGAFEIDVAYQYAWGEDDVDNSRVVGGDFDNSDIEAQAHWAFFLLSIKL